MGFCVGEEEYLEEALNGYYDSSGELLRYGFAQHVAESILSDGIFYERSLGYHSYTLSSYVKLAEAARHSGLDLWNMEITGNQEDAGSDRERRWGETGKKTMKMMFDAPFYYVFPDFSGAAVADSHTYNLKSDMSLHFPLSQLHFPGSGSGTAEIQRHRTKDLHQGSIQDQKRHLRNW